MTDNANDSPELLNVGIEVNDDPFYASVQRMVEELERLQTAGSEAFKSNNEAADFILKLDEISNSLKQPTSNISELQRKIEGLGESYKHLSPDIQQVISDFEDLKSTVATAGTNPGINPESYFAVDPYGAAVRGYGNKGGMIGPAETPPEEDEGGGSFRSTLGVSRGLMAGGQLARQAGLTDVGNTLTVSAEMLRFGEGIGRMTEFLQAAEISINATTVSIGAMEVATGPLVAVFAVLIGILAIVTTAQSRYNEELKQGEEFLRRQLNVNEQYNAAVHTLTSSQASQAIEDEKGKQKIANDNAGKALDLINRTASQLPDAGMVNGMSPENRETNLRGRDELKELYKEYDKYNTQLEDSQAYVGLLTNGLATNSFAMQDNAEYARRATEKKLELASRETEYMQLSSKAANDKIDTLKSNIELDRNQLRILEETGDKSQATQDRIVQLRDAMNLDAASAELLTRKILPLIEVREREAALVEYQKKQAEEIAGIQQKLNDQSKATTEKEAEQEATIHQRAADKIISITEKEIEARTKALEKLQEKEQELYDKFHEEDDKVARKNAFDDLRERQKELTEERDQLTEHLDRLKDIRDKFSGDEYQALLTRDYIALTKLKARQEEEETKEDAHSSAVKQEHEQKLGDERQLLAEQRAFERQERLIAYQNRVKDAIAQEQDELNRAAQVKETELRLNAEAEGRAIDLAQQKSAAQLKILTDEYTASLRIAGMSRDVRLMAEAHIQQDLINQARQYMYQMGEILHTGIPPASYPQERAFAGSPAVEQFAEGGDFSGGKPFTMSEREAETLMLGSKGYNVGGAALVYPLQSGSVVRPEGSSKSITLAPIFNIYEANDIGRIRDEIVAILEEVDE